MDRNNPRRAKSSDSTYTLMDFGRDFPDDATCLDFLWRRNHSPDGERAECPKCGQVRRFHRLRDHPAYPCNSCGHHVHPTAGTIFHKSSTSLVLWFRAIFLMSQTRCGISAKQLEREPGVTYKTAWRMFNRIRKLMADDEGSRRCREPLRWTRPMSVASRATPGADGRDRVSTRHPCSGWSSANAAE